MKLQKPLILMATIALGFTACKQKHGNVNAKLTPPDSILNSDTVSYLTAKTYVNNYARHAGYVDSTVAGGTDAKPRIIKMPDTRAIWFDTTRLRLMLDKIRAEGGDGIRFYLATYDTSYSKKPHPGHIPERQYWGYNTLVMVSTRDSLHKYHHDYYTNIGPAQHSKSTGFLLIVDPENRGEICPPPHDCNSIGATLIAP